MIFVIACFFMTGIAVAKTQSIALAPESVVAFTNETVALDIQYDVIDGNKTTGIGIRIHYNSKFIDSITLSDIYGEGMVGQHYSPQADVTNLDGDVTTDKFIIIAWAGITGGWPVFLSTPGSLAKLNVKIKSDAPNAETKINVSASAAAAGYEFKSKSARLLVQ